MKKQIKLSLFSYFFKQLKVANYQAYSRICKQTYFTKSKETCIVMIF
jgi:hypothetical protein